MARSAFSCLLPVGGADRRAGWARKKKDLLQPRPGVLFKLAGERDIEPYSDSLSDKSAASCASCRCRGSVGPKLDVSVLAVWFLICSHARKHVALRYNLVSKTLETRLPSKLDFVPFQKRMATNMAFPIATLSFEQATAFHRQGRLVDAERHYNAALKAHPTHFGALYGLGIIRIRQGRLDDAVRLLRKALNQNPEYPEALASLADALYGLKRPEEAIKRYEKALALKPDFPEAQNNLGNALQMLGRCEAALSHYAQALTIKPDYLEAWCNMGNALFALNRMAEAKTCYEEVLVRKRDHLDARYNLGCVLQREERHEEAAAHYREVLAISPFHATAHNNLGFILQLSNRHNEALEHFRTALSTAPNMPEAHNNLGRALKALLRPAEALACYRRALELKPDYAEAEINLANALHALEQTDEALKHYAAAIALNPEFADAYGCRGIALRELGRLDEARADLEKAAQLAPRRAVFQRVLANSKKFDVADPQLETIENLLRDSGSLTLEDQAELHFAAGKAFSDLGRYDDSFQHLFEANALKRKQLVYDEAETLKLFDQIRETFTRSFLDAHSGGGNPSRIPIFIVGMPRSGTTLVEQILASHPDVFGAGELTALEDAIVFIGKRNGAAGLSQSLASLDQGRLAEIGRRYVENIDGKAGGVERVSDKMPHNFRFVGLIRLALPKARIIHVRRNPIDTCISCFSQCFSGGVLYSYDLSELGHYYRAYERLMDYWRASLPAGAMLEVQYESVVADLESEARKIIAHCDLPWNEACLAFHETKRRVQTASAVQARQPLYKSSVGRWRHYQKELAPLFEALDISI